MLAIIFGLCLIILALVVEHDKEVKEAYEKGFKRGLYYNVVKITQNNDLEVVSENGLHYE